MRTAKATPRARSGRTILTQAGRRAAERIGQARATLLGTALADLTPTELQDLHTLLRTAAATQHGAQRDTGTAAG